MDDQDKTREQLLAELAVLRQRFAVSEQTEKSLRESGERFQKVFEEGPIGILLVGTDGRIQRANRCLCEMLGYAEAEILALGLASISHPDDWQRDLPLVSRLWRGEISHFHVEKRYLRKDGQAMWAQLTVSLMHDEAGRPTNTVGMIEDITERKQAEERLQNSERTMRTLIDASPESIVLMDTDGTTLLVNATAAHRYGTTVDKLIGTRPGDHLPPEVAAKRMWHIHEVVRTGKAVRFEDERLGRYMENNVHPILDEQGNVAAVAALCIDRTERKRAEEALQKAHDELRQHRNSLEQLVKERTEALQQSHDELRAIYDGMNDGLLIADSETKQFVRANNSICRMLGYAEEELLSRSVTDIHPAKDLPAVLEAFQAQAEGRLRVEVDAPVLRRDGSIFFADIGANKVLYNGRPCVLGFFRDITERKQAEESLKESESRYRELIDNQGGGIGIVDAQEYFIFVNPAGERIFGVPQGGLAGRSLKDFMSPDDYAMVVEQTKNRQAGESGTYEMEIFRPDGETRCLLVTAVPRLDRAGQFIGALGLFFDITDRKRVQESLHREHSSLRHLLQSSDHERQTIAYEIHDGLAQYLAGAIMQFDVYNHLKETIPKDAAKAYDAGITMLRQAHFEARRLISGVRPPILDEQGVVAAVDHLVNEERRKKGPKIEFLSKVEFERLAPIMENAVYRIAQEALANACKHSRSKKIKVELVQHGDRLRIEVHDRGVGFKLDDVEEGQFGLAGIRERARLLGGKTTIESEPGKGARIAVELPIVLKD